VLESVWVSESKGYAGHIFASILCVEEAVSKKLTILIEVKKVDMVRCYCKAFKARP
jgi:hypothetical protein